MSENKDNLPIPSEELSASFAKSIQTLADSLAPLQEKMREVGERWPKITVPPSSLSIAIEGMQAFQERMRAFHERLRPSIENLNVIRAGLQAIDIEPPKVTLPKLLEIHDSVRMLDVHFDIARREVAEINKRAEATETDPVLLEECKTLEESIQEAQRQKDATEEKYRELLLEKLDEIARSTAAMNKNSEMTNLILLEILKLQTAQTQEEVETLYDKITQRLQSAASNVQSMQILAGVARIAYNHALHFL